jgi:glycosyltransferase involved in cell wall biosynthesis
LKVNIVTQLDWPSFRNIGVAIQKVLTSYCDCALYDWSQATPGGNTLFIGTVRNRALHVIHTFLQEGQVVFYGTTEGHSIIDARGLDTARRIKIVAVSDFVKQMLEDVGVPVAGVVHHGLNMTEQRVELQYYDCLKEKFNGKNVILTVASNDPRKGLEKLLQAHRRVEGEREDSWLVLHSEPADEGKEYKQNLVELARKHSIENLWLTKRYGRLSPGKLNALYKLCAIYVQPSFAEGFGLPVLEAFRFNKPVVAVDAPPFNEIIEHKETGILIPSQTIQWFNYKNRIRFRLHKYSSQDLANAILCLLSNTHLRKRMQHTIERTKPKWNIYELYPKLLDYFGV